MWEQFSAGLRQISVLIMSKLRPPSISLLDLRKKTINVDDIDIDEIDSFAFEDLDIDTNENHSFYNKDRQNTIHTYKEMDYLIENSARRRNFD